MKERNIKLAFFGTGNHATDSLYPCIQQIPDARLITVYSRTKEKAEKTADRFGVPSAYNSISSLLDNEKIDGAIVAGPPQMHADVAHQCFEKGIPVFIEKPPAINSATTSQLVESAKKHNTFGMVGFNKRYGLGYRMAKQLISQKEFGDVTFIDIKFSNGGWPPFWDVEERAITFLIGQAIHMFDLIRFLGGDVETVCALFTKRSIDRFGFAVQCKLKNNALVTMNMTCYESWNTFNELVSVTGEGNYVTVENGLHVKYHPEKDWIDVPGSEIYNLYHGWDVSGPMPRTSNFSHEHLGYLGELRTFIDSVRKNKPASPELSDGLRAMQICDAVWKSVQEKQQVQMDH